MKSRMMGGTTLSEEEDGDWVVLQRSTSCSSTTSLQPAPAEAAGDEGPLQDSLPPVDESASVPSLDQLMRARKHHKTTSDEWVMEMDLEGDDSTVQARLLSYGKIKGHGGALMVRVLATPSATAQC